MPEAAAQPRYLVDDDGKQVAVLVDIEQYRVLLEAAEELDAIRAYDAAKASGDEAIPFEQAIAEIEQGRPRLLRLAGRSHRLGVLPKAP